MTFETADYVRRFSGSELLIWYRNGGEIPRQQEAALATAIAAEGEAYRNPPVPVVPAPTALVEMRPRKGCWTKVPVLYLGTAYPSLLACSKATGISKHTLRGWAQRGKIHKLLPQERRTA